MKKLLLILTVVVAFSFTTTSLHAQNPLTGTEYFNGFWTMNIDMAPEYPAMVSFYKNEENKFVGSISGSDGGVVMLDNLKVEGNILTASIANPEMGTITIKMEKKDDNTATGSVMDGASAITCKRYVPEK